MKKLFLGLVLIFFLTSCVQSDGFKTDDMPDDIQNNALAEDLPNYGDEANLPSTDNEVDLQAPDDRASLPEDSSVWVQFYNAQLPISTVVNGEQILLDKGGADGQFGWFFNYYELFGKETVGDSYTAHDIGEIYKDSPQSPLEQDRYISGGSPASIIGNTLYVEGGFDPLIQDVRYEAYTVDNQPDNLVWSEHFKSEIDKVSKDTPLVIVDAWFFDIDGDGIEESIVNANNTLKIQGDASNEQIPHYDNTAQYQITTYFSDDGTAINLHTHTNSYVSKSAISYNDGIYASFSSERLDSDYIESEHIKSFWGEYQFDAEGNIVASPVFVHGESDYPRTIAALIADIDGDKTVELITMQSAMYGLIRVYDFDQNNLPALRFGIITPA